MVAEITPHQILVIAQPGGIDTVRIEKGSRVFQAAEGQDEVLCPHRCRLAADGRNLEAGNVASIQLRFDVDHIGVQPDLDIVRAPEVILVGLAKSGRRVVIAPDLVAELLIRKLQIRRSLRGDGDMVIVIGAQTDDLLGFGVPRIEARAVDRPAAARHPGSGLQVDRIERRTLARPMIGAATEIAKAGEIEVEIVVTDIVALIERLAVILIIETTALEKNDPKLRADQLPCHGDACRPGTGNADISLDRPIPVIPLKIVNHDLKNPPKTVEADGIVVASNRIFCPIRIGINSPHARVPHKSKNSALTTLTKPRNETNQVLY